MKLQQLPSRNRVPVPLIVLWVALAVLAGSLLFGGCGYS